MLPENSVLHGRTRAVFNPYPARSEQVHLLPYQYHLVGRAWAQTCHGGLQDRWPRRGTAVSNQGKETGTTRLLHPTKSTERHTLHQRRIAILRGKLALFLFLQSNIGLGRMSGTRTTVVVRVRRHNPNFNLIHKWQDPLAV